VSIEVSALDAGQRKLTTPLRLTKLNFGGLARGINFSPPGLIYGDTGVSHFFSGYEHPGVRHRHRLPFQSAAETALEEWRKQGKELYVSVQMLRE